MPVPGDEAVAYPWRRPGGDRSDDARIDWTATSLRIPHLITNPADDEDFRQFALSRLEWRRRPDELEVALRTRYPSAAVHVRSLSGEPSLVWYVYRDGHWVGRASR